MRVFLAVFLVAVIARPASASDEDARAALALAGGKSIAASCSCSGPTSCSCQQGTCDCQNCLAAYEWRAYSDDASQIALYLNGVQVGGYNLLNAYYRPYDAARGVWGQKGPCPAPLPVSRPAQRRSAQPLLLPAFTQAFGGDCAGGSCGTSRAAGRRR